MSGDGGDAPGVTAGGGGGVSSMCRANSLPNLSKSLEIGFENGILNTAEDDDDDDVDEDNECGRMPDADMIMHGSIGNATGRSPMANPGLSAVGQQRGHFHHQTTSRPVETAFSQVPLGMRRHQSQTVITDECLQKRTW